MPGLEFVELLERQRVDRPEQPQLTFELAHPARRSGAIGKLRHRRRFGDRRFDVEFTSQRLDRGFEAQLGLGLAELGLPSPFARRVERMLLLTALTTEAIEFRGQPAHLVALATALLDQVGVQHLDDVAVSSDTLDEAVDRADVAFDRHSATLGCDPRLGVGGQAAFGFVEAALEQLLAFVQAGVVDLEVLAARRQRCGAGLEFGAQLAAGARGVGLGLLVGFQRWQQRFEFGDALFVAHDVGGDVVDRSFQVLQFRFGFAVLALCLRQAL